LIEGGGEKGDRGKPTTTNNNQETITSLYQRGEKNKRE
jgi:hypothetical protein